MSSENKEGCDCRRVENYDAQERAGDFYFDKEGDPRYLHITLPGGSFIAIRVSTTNPPPTLNDGRGPVWHWDGNEEKPTLSPSIHAVGHWHGYLKAGRLESC